MPTISNAPRTMEVVPVILNIYKECALNDRPCPTLQDLMDMTGRTHHEINSANVHLVSQGKILTEKIAARRRVYVKSVDKFTGWTEQKSSIPKSKQRKCLVCLSDFESFGSWHRVCDRCKCREGHGSWGLQWE